MRGKSATPIRRHRGWSRSRFGMWAVLAAVAVGTVGLLFAGGLFGGATGDSNPVASGGMDPVAEAYSFAVNHPEILRNMPCYCGCAANGHQNNEECFVDSRLDDGTVVLNPHGEA